MPPKAPQKGFFDVGWLNAFLITTGVFCSRAQFDQISTKKILKILHAVLNRPLGRNF
jgi:hypothetical protein